MRYIHAIVIAMFLFVLTACNQYPYDFNDFEDRTVTTYFEVEHKTNDRYIIYYFDTSKSDLDTIKEEVLPFFYGFTELPFYFIDMADIDTETSSNIDGSESEYIVVMSGLQPLSIYSGSEGVTQFIQFYQSFAFDYDIFLNQHVSSMSDLLDIEVQDYIVYSYSEQSCDSCEDIKDTVLPWIYSKPLDQIYFVNRDTVLGLDNIPTDLEPLTLDEPVMLLMSNGVATKEYYIGQDDVIQYIETILDGEIKCQYSIYDYADFVNQTLTSYDDVLSVQEGIYIVYFYSPYCSHCASIKDEVLPFFATLEEIDFYIINVTHVSGTNPIEGPFGVPALYIVKDGIFVDAYIGSLQIPEMIEQYNNGTLDFFDYQ